MEATLTATVLDCAHRKLVTALQSLEMEKAIHDQSTSLKDYWELTKPTVVALMLLTSVVGMLMAVPGMVPAKILILGNLINAYQEVAKRLGILHEQSNIQAVNFEKPKAVKNKK